ncbi:MAG TPA: serine hydrolase [Vicinamibacterales bacterium]
MRHISSLLALAGAGLVAVSGLAAASSLPRSTPEAQGIASAAILAFVDEAERKLDALHSLMIVRHGHVVAEGWWAPYAADEPHMLYSLSKSFTSTAVGLAVEEGRLSVDDPVLKFFPGEAPADPGVHLKAMRVRDLLTMTAGHHEEDIRNFPYTGEGSVVKAFFARPVAHKPGTLFVYNTPASYMLSAIVQKVTGQTVLDYLRPRLFAPLGIEDPTWEASREGISMGGFGLNLRTEDIAKFGELYLRKGRWQGRQLVPAAWVEAATSRQVSNGSSPDSDWEQGYGYQFWRSRHGFYRGDGAHGQFCLVLPQHDTVIAITAGTRDMASVMNLVWDRLVPALGSQPLPEDTAAHGKLTSRLRSLTLPTQTSLPAPALARDLIGRRYTFPANAQKIEAVSLVSSSPDGTATLAVRIAGEDREITATPGAWRKGTRTVNGTAEPIAATGGWTASDTYALRVARYRTPFVTSFRLQFAGDTLALHVEPNVGPAESRVASLTGTAEKPATATQGR